MRHLGDETARLKLGVCNQLAHVVVERRAGRMATCDGARALGIDSRVGSLEAGKDADLCAVSLDGAHVRPVGDPVAAVVHAARASDVILTAVRGKVLYRSGRALTIDEAAARDAIERVAGKAGAALAVWVPGSVPAPPAAP